MAGEGEEIALQRPAIIYDLLCVALTAYLEEIQRRFKNMALWIHLDKMKNNGSIFALESKLFTAFLSWNDNFSKYDRTVSTLELNQTLYICS